ncbi:cysteine synthase 2-like isoform X3 [Vitis riparia]|uniref:cysteine synthase 2-like isoform X3 n=1 Tax=Vitis riparia TaxID=96939 RepID=UPI00155A75E1|nr:cysteine synthase 2-like isoform X3 [Vitis riparia]
MAPVKVTGPVFAALSIAVLSYLLCNSRSRKTHKPISKKKPRRGLIEAIGNTPLIRINSLSEATGCEILGKAEFLNPGGSVKDRVAVKIIEESQILEALGATVERVRPVSITHKDHYVNVARRRALEANELASKHGKYIGMDADGLVQANGHISEEEKQNSVFSSNCKGGFFADQFENLANFRAHYEGTGPEIWEQTGGDLHAFVAAAGTGGTLAGVSRSLQEKSPNIKCFLIDPPGSGLFNKITRGVMYTREEAEGRRLKNPFDTITEGIGINRLTQNFLMAELDGAFRGTDMEAVEMSRYLLKNDGLFVGSSSAMNCVGAVRVAQSIGPGHTIVTILCDSGMRHLSKFYDSQYLSQHGLTPTATGLEFLGIS